MPTEQKTKIMFTLRIIIFIQPHLLVCMTFLILATKLTVTTMKGNHQIHLQKQTSCILFKDTFQTM